MSVTLRIDYEGGLRCHAVHGPSGAQLRTDAPVDNHGRGESFSPTDLVATALGACMLTILGIVAERHGLDLRGASATVEKHMVADPERRIGALPVRIRIPLDLAEEERRLLERAAAACPVCRSLAPGVERPVEFVWGAPDPAGAAP